LEKSLVKNLSDFIRDEKTKIKLREISDSEFWLEGPYGFLTARFFVDVDAREISYDVFSPKYDLHLKEESLRDVEKLERIMEEKGEWDYEKPIEELRLILDCARLWAHNSGFSIKEKPIV
jgi:hypothetical protein